MEPGRLPHPPPRVDLEDESGGSSDQFIQAMGDFSPVKYSLTTNDQNETGNDALVQHDDDNNENNNVVGPSTGPCEGSVAVILCFYHQYHSCSTYILTQCLLLTGL